MGTAVLLGATIGLAACSDNSGGRAEQTATPSAQPTVTETVSRPANVGTNATASPDVDPAPSQEQAVAGAGMQMTIPAHFRGKWAKDREACDIPSHQVFDIRANEIGFFESTGRVRNVRVDGNAAAATITEQYGDAAPATYAFYMALEGPDAMRVRYDKRDSFDVIR